jgi:hypothetical protein
MQSAKRRGYSWELTDDEAIKLLTGDCYYCGAAPSNETQHKNQYGTFRRNGIDRIDNSIGYTQANCVPCCSACNYAKRELSHDEFINMARIIAARFQTATA